MLPKNVFPISTEVNSQNHLVIGGCDTTVLAKTFGTPLYIFDEITVRHLSKDFIREFRDLHPNTTVAYGSKAFTNKTIARILLEEGLGLDVVSGGELSVAVHVGFPLQDVYFHGNNKSQVELEYALQHGIGRVVVDNFYELELLNNVAATLDKVQDILIRVSPNVDPHTHSHTTTGTLDSKFGFPIETGQAEEAIRIALEKSNINPIGIHAHLGSPIFETDPYSTAIEILLNFTRDLTKYGFQLKEFSPGGGFAIAYTRDQKPPSIRQYAQSIVTALIDNCTKFNLPIPKLIVEPGRSIIGPAGVAIYTVGAIKNIPNIRKYVSVDGGMGDNIRPALYDSKYEAVVANRVNDDPEEIVTIAGKFCESGDILVKDVALPTLQHGDLIGIPSSGAYCPSMASTYNLNPRPAIVLTNEGNTRLIRRRDTFEDMTRTDLD